MQYKYILFFKELLRDLLCGLPEGKDRSFHNASIETKWVVWKAEGANLKLYGPVVPEEQTKNENKY